VIPCQANRMLIVILNFNGIKDTLACLDSLLHQTRTDFEVLVIDNGSRADDLSLITECSPATEVITLTDNLGWAGGNNVGLRLALSRGYGFVCLLNNDTVLEPEAIAELLIAAAVIDNPCLLHPGIFYFDEPARPQMWPEPSATADPGSQRLAATFDIIEMSSAYGACLVLPVTTLRRVGLFDERFFLQLEEQDYYRRAATAGLRSYCARRARILHKESASFGGRVTPAKLYYSTRNSLLLAEKHDMTARAIARSLYQLLGMLQNRAVDRGAAKSNWSALRWLLSSDVLARAAREGIRDYVRRRFGPRPGPRLTTQP
jgi:GT2 family glycosyltransferase